MISSKTSIEGAIQDFAFMRSHQPYRFGGKWYISNNGEKFVAYRTKKAAINNAKGEVWFLDFTK